MSINSKYTYTDIKMILENKGYKLLSKELCSSKEKMDYICLKHQEKGVQHISIYHAIAGRGCYYCGKEKSGKAHKAKINKESDRKLCERRGFEYVDTVVEDNIVWICMICPKHRHVGIQRVKKANLKRETTYKCIYCVGRKVHPLDSFGNKHPDFINLWSTINIKTPFDYSPFSNENVWFKCENGLHDDFKKSINDVSRRGLRCPKCAQINKESWIQRKVRLYFEELGYSLNHEYNCSIIDTNPLNGYQMPYDNQEDDKLKLIIEVHGKQHYEIDKFTIMQSVQQNKDPKEILKYQQWKDKHKEEYALSQGYSYLIIPYWTIKNDEYKFIIDDKINKILNKDKCFNN